MKKLLALTLGLALLSGLAVRAADGDKKEVKPDPAARRAELIKKYDKNGDGKLDDEEKAAMREDIKKQREARKEKKDAK